MRHHSEQYEDDLTNGRVQNKRRIKSRWLFGLLLLTTAAQVLTVCLAGEFFPACVNAWIILLLTALLVRDRLMMNRALRQVEQACRMRTDFLATISHEIRTPLNSIIGFSELLAETDLDDEQAEYLDPILLNSQNLLVMVNDILDFTHLSTGKLRAHSEPTSLTSLLEHLEKTYYSIAARKGITFAIIPRHLHAETVAVDAMRLTQCLANLLSNALKFTSQGHVYMWVESFQEQGRAGLRFDIEDTGIGISPAQQVRIFEAFTQGDSSPTRRYGGIGLGLTLAYRLADLLGGRLTFTSEPACGSTFTLCVPCRVCGSLHADGAESTLQCAG